VAHRLIVSWLWFCGQACIAVHADVLQNLPDVCAVRDEGIALREVSDELDGFLSAAADERVSSGFQAIAAEIYAILASNPRKICVSSYLFDSNQ